MKTFCYTLLLTLLALGAFAQNIVIKNNLILVDKQPYARLEFDGNNLYYVSSPQGERLFVVKNMTLNDPDRSNPANPTGATDYLQFVFTASRTIVETPYSPSLQPTARLARQLYLARLIKNGSLDAQAVADFVVNNGAPYSERRQALNHPALVVPPSY